MDVVSGIWYGLPLASAGRTHFLRVSQRGSHNGHIVPLAHCGVFPLRAIFPLHLWQEEKLKLSGVVAIHFSLKVYFKKQQKKVNRRQFRRVWIFLLFLHSAL